MVNGLSVFPLVDYSLISVRLQSIQVRLGQLSNRLNPHFPRCSFPSLGYFEVFSISHALTTLRLRVVFELLRFGYREVCLVVMWLIDGAKLSVLSHYPSWGGNSLSLPSRLWITIPELVSLWKGTITSVDSVRRVMALLLSWTTSPWKPSILTTSPT